jgi:hypothetical protein
MANKLQPYPRAILQLMEEQTAFLSKAHALAQMDMPETAQPVWLSAASCEERLAPLLEAIGREREAAVHRISAASCYQRAGELNRAVNLYRAALAGPLDEGTQRDVQRFLADCLKALSRSAIDQQPPRRPGKATSGAK